MSDWDPLATYQYYPYGNLTSSTGSVANPWRFAAGYFDSSTGLYKFGTRYYNPGFGRWSQQDPLRGQLNDPTSLNRYVYAGDDPVNFTDPSGLSSGDLLCIYLSASLLRAIGWLLFAGAIITVIIGMIALAPGITIPLAALILLIGALIGYTGAAFWELAAEYPDGITICIPRSDSKRPVIPR